MGYIIFMKGKTQFRILKHPEELLASLLKKKKKAEEQKKKIKNLVLHMAKYFSKQKVFL